MAAFKVASKKNAEKNDEKWRVRAQLFEGVESGICRTNVKLGLVVCISYGVFCPFPSCVVDDHCGLTVTVFILTHGDPIDWRLTQDCGGQESFEARRRHYGATDKNKGKSIPTQALQPAVASNNSLNRHQYNITLMTALG